MTEKLLQFIWKNRYFNQQGLELVTGEPVVIEYPGEENSGQGPDFTNARIGISGNSWIGSVELHLLSSGWTKHGHADDTNYKNVILHVVWKQDDAIMNRNIPQLELESRISFLMLDTYAGWMQNHAFIPCAGSVRKMNEAKWADWLSTLLVNRLERKMQIIETSLYKNQYHWEEQLWWMITAQLGNPVNTEAFDSVARSIPFNVLRKHRGNFIQLEALFAGQAGLLEKKFQDDYALLLQREYNFLRKKYQLKKIYTAVLFLRMRPESFPGIRFSQLAALYTENGSLFDWCLQCHSLRALQQKIRVKANDYWNTHFVLDKQALHLEKQLGFSTGNGLIINSIIPLLYAYGKLMSDPVILNKALSWLQQLSAEKNRVISGWKRIGISVKTAAGSQALLELKKQHCDRRKCLDCETGKYLLRPDK